MVVNIKNSADGDFGVKDETRDTDSCECLEAARGNVCCQYGKEKRGLGFGFT
jgi:hypothetical protein